MKYVMIVLLAAVAGFSQSLPGPAAALKEGGTCSVDNHDASKLRCRKSSFVLSIDATPRVSRIDGKGPQAFGLKSRDFFNPRGKFQVPIIPGEHTVEISYHQIGGGDAYTSAPETTSFTAVAGHTYAAIALVNGSRWTVPSKWVPAIYDETESQIVSVAKAEKN